MRQILLTLSLTLFTSLIFAKEIEATVVFENLTDKALTSGLFTIVELNQTIEVNTAESFTITLPEKGKYQFSFVSDDFNAYTVYPERINRRKNTITIRLMDKTKLKKGNDKVLPVDTDKNLTNEQIEQRIAEGTLNFIIHGIDHSIPEAYVRFKEAYGIGVVKKNCMIDPLSYKKAIKNNQMIADYLNKKYGTAWLSALQIKPLGIK
ncbi:MAG: hypothetical protein CR968_05025 [Flavobacteriia bacterium]|nr:MAG: hypothetical protein CR968_05025 [Flavobacteriia bacterium]